MCLLQAWLLHVSTPQRNPGFSSKVLVSVPWISWCNAVWSIVVVKSCSSEDREKKKNRKNKKREGACLWLFSLPPFFFFLFDEYVFPLLYSLSFSFCWVKEEENKTSCLHNWKNRGIWRAMVFHAPFFLWFVLFILYTWPFFLLLVVFKLFSPTLLLQIVQLQTRSNQNYVYKKFDNYILLSAISLFSKIYQYLNF